MQLPCNWNFPKDDSLNFVNVAEQNTKTLACWKFSTDSFRLGK